MMLGAFLAFAFTALVFVSFASVAVDGLWRPDAFDYAQIGRELAEGRGFSSRQAIYALHLEFLAERGLLEAPWPNLHRFPLPSLLMAAGFRMFGTGDAVVVGYGILFQAATSALLFVWARAAIGLAAAVAVVFLFTINGAMLETGCSGLSEPPVMFFATLALYAVWRQGQTASLLLCAAAGAALGLATLARTNALFVAPLFGVALAMTPADPPRRWVAVGVFTAGLVAVVAPWWVRNAIVAGDPFFSLHAYFLLPSGSQAGVLKWDLFVPWVTHFVSPLEWFAEHPGAVLSKWLANLGRWLSQVPTLAGTTWVPLVAAAALFREAGEGLRRIAVLLVLSFIANALLVSFSDFYLLKYHLHFVPGLMLLAVGVVWQLVLLLSGSRLRLVVLACAVLALADLDGAAKALRFVPASIARYDRPHWDFIRENTREDDVILSDQSHAVVWETGRRSVRLHYDRTPDGQRIIGSQAIESRYLPIDAIYLSRQFLRDPAKLEILSRSLERQDFRRTFANVHQFEGGGFLLRRRSATRQR